MKPEKPTPGPVTLGEHIRKRRLELQLTLKEAGKLLGTDGKSINNWEKGRTSPRAYWLPAIIYFLGYNPLPQPRTLPEQLIARRLELGWSRTVAARQLGINITTLRDWEHGNIILLRKHQRLVASLLSISESELGRQMKARWKDAHWQTNASSSFGVVSQQRDD